MKTRIYSKLNLLRPGNYILKSAQHRLINFVREFKKKKFIVDPSRALKDQKNPKISKEQLKKISSQFIKINKLKKTNIKEIYQGIFEFTC